MTPKGRKSIILAVVLVVSVVAVSSSGIVGATSPPVADFSWSPSTPNPDDTVTLDASASTNNGSIESYEWDTDGDGRYGEYGDDASDGETATVSYDSGGTYTVGLKITDNDGNVDTVRKQITVENPAPDPSFTYSPSAPNPDDTITLDASGSSDPDGNIVSYEWDTDGDGRYGEYGDDASDGETTTVSFVSGGTYTVGLRVEDNGGKTRETTVQITVENPAPEPSFTYSPSTPNPDDTITLDASGSSDPDGTIVSYEWDTDGDGRYGEYGDDASDGQTTSVKFETGGTYTVGLKVEDNGGKTREATKQITVENPAPDPSFTYSPSTPNPDDTITLDASGSSDPDGNIVSYEWDTDGDGRYGEYSDDASDGETTTVSFDTAGTYSVRLKITDNGDKTRTITKQITVENPPPVPSFTYSPSTPNPDDTITLDASGSSDPDGNIVSYEWDTDGDGRYGEYGDDAPDGQTTTVSFNSEGTYTIQLKVIDNGDVSRTVSKQITVKNPAPNADFTYSNAKGNSLRVRLDASPSSDPDGSIQSFDWYIGGHRVGSGQHYSHTFDEKGEYSIRLVVEDNGGKTAESIKSVSVTRQPVAEMELDTTIAGVGEEVRFSGRDSSDPDGSIEQYIWKFPDGDQDIGASVTKSFSEPGSITIELTVIDDSGAESTVKRTIQVKHPPHARMRWKPRRPADDRLVVFNGSSSADIQEFRWDLDNDDRFEKVGQSVEYRFADGGEYTVRMKAIGPDGVAKIIQKTITVREVNPQANFSWKPIQPRNRQDVVFQASSSDNITQYEWDFDNDGNPEATGAKAVHSFNEIGRKIVTLIVYDKFDDRAEITKVLRIQESASFELSIAQSQIETGGGVVARLSISNNVPDEQILAKLNFNLSGTDVTVSSVSGSGLAGPSETEFITVDAGQSASLGVRLQFSSPGTYTIEADVIYFLGSPETGDRRTSKVGPIQVAVTETETETIASPGQPGFSLVIGLLGVIVAILLSRGIKQQ